MLGEVAKQKVSTEQKSRSLFGSSKSTVTLDADMVRDMCGAMKRSSATYAVFRGSWTAKNSAGNATLPHQIRRDASAGPPTSLARRTGRSGAVT